MPAKEPNKTYMRQTIATFGELLLRLSPQGTLRLIQTQNTTATFGGSEANVAVSLANFGHNVRYLSRVPENNVGRACLSTLHQYNVNTDFVALGGPRLGSYYMETAASLRSSKVVYDREDSSFTQIEPKMIDWENAFKGADWFHWSGIAAALSESTAECCRVGIDTARKMGVKLSCDLNYRKNLWNYDKTYEEVVLPLVNFSDIVFGSDDEYEHLIDMKPGEFQGVVKTENGYEINKPLCEKIMRKAKELYPDVKLFACETRRIVSSNHHVNAAILYDGKQVYFSRIYDVDNVIDAVGVGDACCAALLDALSKYGEDYQSVIEFAMSASALKNTIPGDFNLVSEEEVLTLMGGNTSGRVLR